MADDNSVSADPPQVERPENLPNGPVGDAIYEAARAHGMDPRMLGGIASIESNYQPSSNYNKPTQYKGLFQIGREEWGQYGNGNIYDARDNADAAARMLSDHANWFKDTYGRDASPAEIYMMHQQGRGFFTRGAMSNIAGNPYPRMSGPQDHNSFMGGWGRELARRMNVEAGNIPTYAGGTAEPGSAPSPTGTHASETSFAGAGTPAEAAQSEAPALPDFATHEEDPIRPSPMMKLPPPVSRLRAAMAKNGGVPQVPFPSPVAQRLIDMLGKQQG